MMTFKHFLNKLKYMTILRLYKFPCEYIAKNSYFFKVSSYFVTEIKDIFNREYNIENVLDNDKDAVVSRISFIQNHEETLR